MGHFGFCCSEYCVRAHGKHQHFLPRCKFRWWIATPKPSWVGGSLLHISPACKNSSFILCYWPIRARCCRCIVCRGVGTWRKNTEQCWSSKYPHLFWYNRCATHTSSTIIFWSCKSILIADRFVLRVMAAKSCCLLRIVRATHLIGGGVWLRVGCMALSCEARCLDSSLARRNRWIDPMSLQARCRAAPSANTRCSS